MVYRSLVILILGLIGSLSLTAQKREDSQPVSISLKSNLVMDAIALPNVELELGMGRRFSTVLEYTSPWFEKEDKSWANMMVNGGLELRLWDQERTVQQPTLHGKFIGVYYNAGYFDLERNRRGTQTDFFQSAGIVYGYVYNFNRHLSAEFSLGVGYLTFDYTHYHLGGDDENLVRHYSGRHTWVGPTKAKVSLVWNVSQLWDKRSSSKQRK